MTEKRYALVTGASRGIGRAIAIKLASCGYSVIINYSSNVEAAQQTLEEIVSNGGNAELLPFDVSSYESTSSALKEWSSHHTNDYISVIVNNAGICRDNLMVWMPDNDWNSVIGTSLNGFWKIC